MANFLSNFSDIIRQQGEEREARQQALLTELAETMSHEVAKLATLNNIDLLDLYVQHRQYYSDPREHALRHEFADHIRVVILRRMS